MTASGVTGHPDGLHLSVEPSPAASDVALLEERVAAAALAAVGADEEQEFGIFVRDPAGAILAGISGIVLGRCCELEAMWVTDALRGHGLARVLIAGAEAEAQRRGCSVVMFHTYDAMTGRLYDRLGYRTVGTIEDGVAGCAVRWYAKDL